MEFDALIQNLEGSRPLWVHKERVVSAKDIREETHQIRQTLFNQEGLCITLELSCPIDALLWMIALDGRAESVFLAPASLLGTEEYETLKVRAGCSHLVTDKGLKAIRDRDAHEIDSQSGSSDVSTQWILATSGTTGTPKLIKHSTASLTRTCKADPQRGKDYVWGLVYDPFRFAGLQVVLQALASGSKLVMCHDSTSISQQATVFRENGVNALSATPTYWRKLLMSGVLKGHSFKQITLGGEPADQSVLNALKAAFPTSRIVHIYASTEAGVGFSVNDGKVGFPVEYLENGVGKIKLRISEEGTLQIKPESYTPSTSDDISLADSDGFVDTGDLVEVRNGRVLFLGRDSGAINVGGNKVIPEEVESVIRSVAGVGEVIVKPKNSGVMGQLVTAEVLPDSQDYDRKELKESIMRTCREQLERFKIPALIRFVESIDYTPTGKINRK